MKTLTRFEEAFLESVLENEKEKAEAFLKNNGDSFEASFVRNETLPLLKSILGKIEI